MANHLDKDIKNLSLDMPFPPGKARFSIAGEWILKEPFKILGDIPAGKESSVTLPTLLDGRQPLEDAVIRATLRSADGTEWVAQDSLWLLPAPRATKPPEVDGKLEEWEGRSAAWMFYDYAWAPLGRSMCQLDEGAEQFGYLPYTVDARAAIWASWDPENLYLAIRLDDDQPVLDIEKGESLRILIKPQGKESLQAELRPSADGKGSAILQGTSSPKKNLKMRSVNTKNATRIEVAIPWTDLGTSAKQGELLGFDFYWTDVDRNGDKLVSGTMRWAGASKTSGYLLLK